MLTAFSASKKSPALITHFRQGILTSDIQEETPYVDATGNCSGTAHTHSHAAHTADLCSSFIFPNQLTDYPVENPRRKLVLTVRNRASSPKPDNNRAISLSGFTSELCFASPRQGVPRVYVASSS